MQKSLLMKNFRLFSCNQDQKRTSKDDIIAIHSKLSMKSPTIIATIYVFDTDVF